MRINWQEMIQWRSYRLAVRVAGGAGTFGPSAAAVDLFFPLSSAIQCIRDMQAHLAEPLLVVEWESSSPEVDSWVVEWLPETAESEFSALSWESVSHVTNWTIEQGSWHRPCSLP